MTAWKDGIPNEWGYDRYGDSPYYDVPEGWAILVEHDWAGSYEFSQIVVWQNKETGELRAAYDSGCSCPTPFGDLNLGDALHVTAVDDLQPLVEKAADFEDWSWDSPDDKLVDLKAKVHRALRDGVKS